MVEILQDPAAWSIVAFLLGISFFFWVIGRGLDQELIDLKEAHKKELESLRKIRNYRC